MDNSSTAFDLLESALDQAFSVPLPRETTEIAPEEATVATESAPSSEPEVPTQLTESTPEAVEDSWKAEYEVQVQSWRAQSAEAREKAEKERLKWEAIRAIEREEAAKRKAAGLVDEPPVIVPESETKSEIWESVGELTTTAASTDLSESAPHIILPSEQPSLAVPDETTSAQLPRTDSQLETATNESQKWEDVPSVTSSFPSMSFPEHIETPPRAQPALQPAPGSVTLAIFDSSLSPRTRLTALFSSLAINLLLPFVNGVMLGFGEIFAKNVVMQWFGWKPSYPASMVTNVGLRPSREERQRQSK